MSTPKVVILCMENRSFDEYFGTYPGPYGFYDTDPTRAAIFAQTGFKQNSAQGGASIGSLNPFRTSLFSTQSETSYGCNHMWPEQHKNLGTQDSVTKQWPLNGWANGQGAGAGAMGYYASNDVPYHWQLAQNFLLCDTYFCSVLGPTGSNRLFLMSGTVFADGGNASQDGSNIVYDQAAYLPAVDNAYNPTPGQPASSGEILGWNWQSFPAMLPAAVGWKIYDDQNWGPPWLAWSPPDPPTAAQPPPPPSYLAWQTPGSWPGWYDLNVLTVLQDKNHKICGIGTGTSPGDANYVNTGAGALQSQFICDALNGKLPDISWIIPPSYLTEHPNFLPADGECYLARIVNAVMTGPDWFNTILIITYDENDGHFDHFPPPISQNNTINNEQWISGFWTNDPSDGHVPWPQTPSGGLAAGGAPVGGGFRVPTIIVSPWTINAGLASSLVPAGTYFDHTSIVQYLEDVFNTPCTNLPNPGWRRNTFKSLSKLLNSLPAPPTTTTFSNANPPPTLQLPLAKPDDVDQWRLDALTRCFGTVSVTGPNSSVLPPVDSAPIQAWPPLQQQCYFIMDKTTFGRDEVEAQSALQHTVDSATFPNAFWLVVDGFEPAELNLPSQISLPSTYLPTFPAPPILTVLDTHNIAPGISVTIGPAQADNSGLPPVPQRFRFPCNIVFNDITLAFTNVTVATPSLSINVNATFASTPQRLVWNAPTEQIELVASADPFIQNGAVTYLCPDLRVYEVQAGETLFGATLPASVQPNESAAAITFIQTAIAKLNAPGSTLGQPFNTPPSDPAEADISTVTLYPCANGNTGPVVYNFAILRVSLQGLSDIAYNVRVFFRLCPAASTGTAFDPTSLYRRTPTLSEYNSGNNPSNSSVDTVTVPNPNAPTDPNDPSYPWQTRVPLLGILGSDYVTFPFFATPRVTPGFPMATQPPDFPNTQKIKPDLSGAMVYAYFGCWLDINQSAGQFNSAPPPTGSPDGPFTSPQSIASRVMNSHQCLVAEISFDSIPIPLGANPGDNDQLAQRNLVVIGGTNG
jgi:phospholipase C